MLISGVKVSSMPLSSLHTSSSRDITSWPSSSTWQLMRLAQCICFKQRMANKQPASEQAKNKYQQQVAPLKTWTTGISS